MYLFPDLAKTLNAELRHRDDSRTFSGISIDTRTLQKNNLFVALKGVHQDGHRFLEEAFQKGASGALISKSAFRSNPHRFEKNPELCKNLLLVPNPEKALLKTASWLRAHHGFHFIGITGSVGKTTTKDILSYLLGIKYMVLSTKGNFNNHLGLPLTLSKLRREYDYCVAELGANHVGEIAQLADILRPTAAILTRVSEAHLEGFGSLENIYKAKLELFQSLPQNAIAVTGDQDPTLNAMLRDFPLRVIKVGSTSKADYRISKVKVHNNYVHFTINDKWSYSFPSVAPFLAYNAGLALAMIDQLGCSLGEIPENWTRLQLPDGRFQVTELRDHMRVIYDGYNSSPASFEKALEVFSSIRGTGRHILVFSDMLELGHESAECHRRIGKKIAGLAIDRIVAYGQHSEEAVSEIKKENKSLPVHYFSGPEEAAGFLETLAWKGDVILLKASRGMHIEKVYDRLVKNFGTEPRLQAGEPA